MSVALLIRDSEVKEYDYFPIATEKFFKQYWLPKAIEEDLTYVMQFEVGIKVNQTNIEQVINNLKILNTRVSIYSDISEDIRAFWLSRLLTIINVVESRRMIKSVDAYIS